MKLYHEYCLEPKLRNGTMIPLSAVPEILKREDTGYCSVYRFDEQAVLQIRAQGSSQGLGRFPVYTDRLWMDFDGADYTDESVRDALSRAHLAAAIFKAMNASYTVWKSGGKGYHICVRIEPMSGVGVPHSQAEYIRSLGIQCDMTLYQHGRLLSNPGRLHKKTGTKKTLVHTHVGTTLLKIPYVEPLERSVPDRENMSDSDLAKVVYSRMGILVGESPTPGDRHTQLWSLAMSALEAGMPEETVWQNLLFINSLFVEPKDEEGLRHCLTRAVAQSQPTSRKL